MLINMNEQKKTVVLYGADGRAIELIGEPKPIVVDEPITNQQEEVVVNKEKNMDSNDPIYALIAELQQQLAAAKQEEASKKNQRVSKVTAGRKYELLSEKLALWGNVPQQQKDLAHLLASYLEMGMVFTEEEVFDYITKHANEYPSLAASKQDPTYLFRYYRGLKNDGKYAGFIARNFIRMS